MKNRRRRRKSTGGFLKKFIDLTENISIKSKYTSLENITNSENFSGWINIKYCWKENDLGILIIWNSVWVVMDKNR